MFKDEHVCVFQCIIVGGCVDFQCLSIGFFNTIDKKKNNPTVQIPHCIL